MQFLVSVLVNIVVADHAIGIHKTDLLYFTLKTKHLHFQLREWYIIITTLIFIKRIAGSFMPISISI